MRFSYGLLGGVLLGLVGCSLGMPAWPPLAVPVEPSPPVYQPTAFRWTPGTQLTYDIDGFAELTAGEHIESQRARGVVQYTAVDRTEAGLIRVELRRPNARRMGDLFIDDEGDVRNASSSDQASRETFTVLARMVESPLTRRLVTEPLVRSRPLRRERGFSAFVPTSLDVLGSSCMWRQDPTVVLTLTLTGRKRLGVTHVMEIQGIGSVPVSVACGSTSQFDGTGTIYGRWYVHDGRGYMVASYEIMTISGEARGSGARVPTRLRTVTSATLDRLHSDGL